MECLGRSHVVIEDGKVLEVGEPEVRYCPMFKRMKGIDRLDKDSIRENIEFRISDFGMCTDDRVLEMDDVVTFGVSEIMSLALRQGNLDAVVLAADGCGTAVVTKPCLVQGLGGRISGLCETEPIPRVVEAVGRENILDPDTASIDMVAGADKAASMGYSAFAVTTPFVSDATEIRRRHGDKAIIIGVHTTGMSAEDAAKAFDVFDIITACASRHLREERAKRSDVMLAGTKVPIFAVSEKGKRLVKAKLDQMGREPYYGPLSEDQPAPLI
jgi:putative methanogenesis marker protein 8